PQNRGNSDASNINTNLQHGETKPLRSSNSKTRSGDPLCRRVGRCVQSRETPCARCHKNYCPRCTEVTHQLRGQGVPSDATFHISKRLWLVLLWSWQLPWTKAFKKQ